MKRIKLLCWVGAIVFLFGACAQPLGAVSATPEVPDGGAANGQGAAEASQQQPEDSRSRLYDPSIFVIQVSDTWRQELAEDYYADYECELYLHKVDSNDNRSSAGVYTGFFWMNMALDADDYLSGLMGDAPVDMGFSASGEGICDNIGFSLRPYDAAERSNYAIPVRSGGEILPEEDMLVDKGSFIVVAKQVYLDAVASGAQGESVDYQDSQSTDITLYYIVHMQSDATEQDTEREVTIYLYDGQGMSTIIFCTMRRLPGYPDDVAQYTQDAPYQQALNQHLGTG